MRILRIYKIILAVVIILILIKPAMAESSKEYAIMAKSIWSAFKCSVLAEESNDWKEQERLFMFGYKQGLKFIDALKSEKIKSEDIPNVVTMGLLFRLQGPTSDFILGRVFEGALDSVLENVYKTGEEFNSDEVTENIAKKEFKNLNCQSIGK